MDILLELERAIGKPVDDVDPLSGGCVGQVYRVIAKDGARFVAKVDSTPDPHLDIEAYMLSYLNDHSKLPVPEVFVADPQLLVISYLAGESTFSSAAQEHAAELLTELHEQRGPAYGFERPTLIAGLHQPNDWTGSWLEFFGEYRLRYMAGLGIAAGRLPGEFSLRIERLVSDLDKWLLEPEAPSLIHGDVWTTNVLANHSQITGFLDPAIYYASPEIELAFITLFGTFGKPFFERYQTIRPIAPGFFEERRDIYNLYPLLVHSRLFGGSYIGSVDNILKRFGY